MIWIDEDDDRYVVVDTAAIPQVTQVRIYESTWGHVETDHPEFAGRLPVLEAAVHATISNPTAVHASTTSPGRAFVFVSKENTHFGHPMAVPVKVVEGTHARMSTAGFRTKVAGDALWAAKEVDHERD